MNRRNIPPRPAGAERVLKYLRSNRRRFRETLCEYLRHPSVSAQPAHRDDMLRCAEWLVEHCRSIGLDAEIRATPGHPIVLARTPRSGSGGKPRFLVYGHYDVQPPDPLELWVTPPFSPTLRKGALYARGASDNKGQHMAHLNAVEAYLKTGTPLPCDLTFLIEGEEEVGSANLGPFIRSNLRELECEAVIISDTGMPAKGQPALTCSLRGVAALEVRVDGPARDLHSGLYGGAVDNPAMVLCQMLASLRDRDGRVAIPGFYEGALELSNADRGMLRRIPLKDADFIRMLGVPRLFGERGFTTHERRTSRPTLEINGLTSGYQGDGSKTIVPAWASAKLTMRLVPNQKASELQELVARHLRKICPNTVRLTVERGHGGDPYWLPPENAFAKASLRALKAAFGKEPLLLREGGSIPIVVDFKRVLKRDTLLLGLALPDDNLHSPNEKFDLECFEKGMVMSALLWPDISRASAAAKPATAG